jgi:two-component system nitrogen regulation response regulator GlnG/two-component system response regulator HydG
MQIEEQLPTDTVTDAPWRTLVEEALGSQLHLVVVWLFEEPHRVGQAARIDQLCWLGRQPEPLDGMPAVRFFEQRPGVSLAAPHLTTTRISRRQLRITPLDVDRVQVDNVGKRELYLNGVVVKDAVVKEGDTLMLEHSAVFVVEKRPGTIAPRIYYPEPKFRFGRADGQGLVGESPTLWRLRDHLAVAAAADAHVLLLGETGVGKELAAGAVHAFSPRKRGPMVARNAATIPGTLLDAELFGNAKHYPHANAPERDGMIGGADRGHLMLDEIGELSAEYQAHLLRVLDSRGQYLLNRRERRTRCTRTARAKPPRRPGASGDTP